MKKCGIFLVLTLVVLSLVVTSAYAAEEQQSVGKFGYIYPVIKKYGPVHPLPNAAVQPDKSLKYKVLFDVTTDKTKDNVNDGLSHVARFINVMDSAGVKPDQMDVVVIIHGPATPVVLKNEEYKKKYDKDNPDRELISELKKANVGVYVCGQALADNKFEHAWVNPDVTIVLSALVFVPTYELKGYGYTPFK